MKARRIVLANYPAGVPSTADFALQEFDPGELEEGQILVAVSHLSMDPFPRLRMSKLSAAGPPMRLGEAVEGRGVGRVVASRADGWVDGDWLIGEVGWQSLARMLPASCEKIDTALGSPSLHLGALGPSGLTAYMTVVELGGLVAGQTMGFAPAAGSVGTVAGQIAQILGAKSIGVAASGQLSALPRFGYGRGVDHAMPQNFAAAVPDGIDLLIDGVGGATHDALVPLVKPRGRIVLLGFISGYNAAGPPHYGSAFPVLMKRARMEGFLLADWRDRFSEARSALARWIRDGRLQPVETIWNGLDRAPAAFAALFGSAAPGKQIVRLEETSE